jgi:hypothetical protein
MNFHTAACIADLLCMIGQHAAPCPCASSITLLGSTHLVEQHKRHCVTVFWWASWQAATGNRSCSLYPCCRGSSVASGICSRVGHCWAWHAVCSLLAVAHVSAATSVVCRRTSGSSQDNLLCTRARLMPHSSSDCSPVRVRSPMATLQTRLTTGQLLSVQPHRLPRRRSTTTCSELGTRCAEAINRIPTPTIGWPQRGFQQAALAASSTTVVRRVSPQQSVARPCLQCPPRCSRTQRASSVQCADPSH